jgi:hypothetical protein
MHQVGKKDYYYVIHMGWDRGNYCVSLRAGRSWDRISVGARFSAPIQTGHEAHPASYTMGTGSLSQW